MWAATVEVEAPARLRGETATGVRYAGVLAVWLVLLAVRPRLACRIWRERREDSPIPRRFGVRTA